MVGEYSTIKLGKLDSTYDITDIFTRRVPAYKPGKHWLTSFFIEISQKKST